MAEFQEVIQQKNRMCQSTECRKCDVYRLCDIYRSCGEDLSICQQFIYNNPKKAEEIIMSWAAKHPGPVYPTWAEWLVEQGVLRQETRDEDAPYFIEQIMFKPIPADTAQKLGLQPKEI